MEFDKYRRLGDYHWREYARPSIYRDYVNGLREWVREPGTLLDVGAGDGLIAHVLKATEAIELDATACDLAAKHGVAVTQGAASNLPFDDESFDAVLIGDVIEHLQDPLPALHEARRVLVPGGRLYVTTPPERKPHRKYHFTEYTPETLRALVEPVGFVLDEPMFTRYDRIHARLLKR